MSYYGDNWEELEHKATAHRLKRELAFQTLVAGALYIIIALLLRHEDTVTSMTFQERVHDWERSWHDFIAMYVKRTQNPH